MKFVFEYFNGVKQRNFNFRHMVNNKCIKKNVGEQFKVYLNFTEIFICDKTRALSHQKNVITNKQYEHILYFLLFH